MLSEPVQKFEYVDNIGNTTSLLAQLVGGGKGSGVAATLAAYSAVPTLRQTVGRVAENVGATRWRLFVSSSSAEGMATARRLRSLKATTARDLERRHKAIEKAMDAGELREVEAHPYLDLLDKANDAMTGLSFRELTQVYIDSVGESFWEIERGDAGLPVALWPISPVRIKKVPMAGDSSAGAAFEVSMKDGETRTLPAADCVWMRKINPVDPYGRGKGIAQALADEIDADEQAAKQIVSFFANNSIPSAVINLKGAAEDAVKAARVGWEQNHGGAARSNKLHFTNAEDMSIMQLSSAFKDSQMIDLRDFENKMLRQTFGVPPEIVGISEDSNRASIYGAESIFGKFVLMPRLEFLRTEQQVWLLPQYPQGERLILEYDNPLPPDQDLQADLMRAAPWAFSVNEVRNLAGQPPFDGEAGAARWIPSGGDLMSVEDALEEDQPDENGDHSADVDAAAEGEQSLGKSYPSPVKRFGVDDVEAVDAEFDAEDLLIETEEIAEKVAEEFGQDMLDLLGVGLIFSILAIEVQDALTAHRAHMVFVNETSQKIMREKMQSAIAAGAATSELRTVAESVFDNFAKTRAPAIANSEVVMTASSARLAGMRAAGVTHKIWYTRRDERVRKTHTELESKVLPLNERYRVSDGDSALYPGNFSTVNNNANCRCVLRAHSKGRKNADDRMIAEVVSKYQRWEAIYAAALNRGFAKQRSRVLRVFG